MRSLIEYYQALETNLSLNRGVARYLEFDAMLGASHLQHYASSSVYRHLDLGTDWQSVSADLRKAMLRAADELDVRDRALAGGAADSAADE